MKVVFLDIDGVLTSLQSSIYFNRKKGSPKMEDLLCPIATSNLLRVLEEHPDCVIVVSSSWRKYRSVRVLAKILARHGIETRRVIDKTGILPDEIRGEEIKDWLNKNKKLEISHFVIIDDDIDMGDYLNSEHFVKINSKVGLTWTEVDSILKYFGNYNLKLSDLKIGVKYRLFSKPVETQYIYTETGLYYLDKDGTMHPAIFFDPNSESFALVK